MRLLPILALAGLAFSAVVRAEAAGFAPYTEAALTAAQAQHQAVLLEVHAPWCPTCLRQQRVLKAMMAEPQYQGIAVLVVDFDSETALLERLNIPSQSTLVLMRDGKELGRAVAVTKPEDIRPLLDLALPTKAEPMT